MSKLIGAKLGETAYLSVTDDGKLQYSLTGKAGDFVEFETSGGGGDIDTSNLTATADDLLAPKTAIGLDGAEITGTIQTVTLQQNGNTVSIAKGYVAEDASITVPGEGGGTDISDATATADMVLADAIFYGLNGRDTGTIQTVTATLTDNVVTVPKGYIAEAQTLTVATATASKSGNVVTIPKGYHQGQTLTVGTAKEAETIVPGDTDIVIPADTYLAGDLTIQAVGESGGGETGASMAFYKCTEVDSEGWTGVLMQQDASTGTWSASTTDPVILTVQYLTPKVGEIYSEDTSIRVRQMYAGSTWDYAVYLPLTSAITTAPTGQTVTTVGDPVFTTTGGVECMSLDGSSGLQIPDTDVDFGGDLTVACKVRYDDLNDGVLFHIGTAQANDLLIMNSGSTQWTTGTAGSGGQIVRVSSTINTGAWYEIAIVVSNGTLSFYQDGTLLDSASWNIALKSDGNVRVGFGLWNSNNTWFFTGQLSQFMIFNRALSTEEIGKIFE